MYFVVMNNGSSQGNYDEFVMGSLMIYRILKNKRNFFKF